MTNTYLAGFQTLDREPSGAELNWQGTPPVWLNGVLLSTGAVKFEARAAAYRHWFDGLAMLSWLTGPSPATALRLCEPRLMRVKW
jgi:beta,beta-carotene 9',10'-dioxygenase